MSSKTRSISLRSIILAIALIVSLFPNGVHYVRAATGLANAGFEDGLNSWTTLNPVADFVGAVGTDTATQYPAYANMNIISVTPNRGSKMLRLGTPKTVNQAQNPGTNAIYQTFTASTKTLGLAFQVFSWEFRGYDSVTIDVTQNDSSVPLPVTNYDGTPFSITMPGGTVGYNTTPITVVPNVGKMGNYLAPKDWFKIRIGNPNGTGFKVGETYKITYRLTTTNNNSHGTWAYFDNLNTPPVAKFTFSPLGKAVEGGLIHFQDQSYDVDPGDAVVSWLWTITYPSGKQTTSNLKNPSFLPPDDGTYQVSLTVADKDGTTNTATSGGTATDGSPVPAAIVFNAPPLVGALNIEVRYGDDVNLVGRFVDTGWLDKHTTTWHIPGFTDFVGNLTENNKAIVDKGTIIGKISGGDMVNAIPIIHKDAKGNLINPYKIEGCQLTVRDNETMRSSGIATFTITVIPNNPADNDKVYNREPNNNLNTTYTLNTGGIYTSYIQSAGDIDIFEVKLPTGALPFGSKIMVKLKSLPADFDLALVNVGPAGSYPTAEFDTGEFDTGEFDTGEFDTGEFDTGEFDTGEFDTGALHIGEFDTGEFDTGEFDTGALHIGEFDTGEFDTGAFNGASIGSGDIKLGEIGLSSILTSRAKVVGFSANRGKSDEALITRIAAPQTQLFVVVLGANGSRSLDPYALQIEASTPFIKTLSGTPLVTSGPLETRSLITSPPTHPLTLFVTQWERLQALNTTSNFPTLLAKLTTLAKAETVQGDIISVERTIYDDWDRNPSIVEEANKVSSQVRTIIQNYLASHPASPSYPGIKYVVLVGDDDVIPYRRVPDETVIGNERFYLLSSRLQPGTPLYSSILAGQNLTDDYYVDNQSTPSWGRDLYVPDIPIGRLVETPEEIGGIADAFVNTGGVLSPTTGYVSGYDFFSDGAEQVKNSLNNRLSVATSIYNPSDATTLWDANALRNGLFATPTPDISAPNAHYTHYAALSAKGFYQPTTTSFSDKVLTTMDLVGTTAKSLLAKVLFTIGCHAGLNVPDRSSIPNDPALGVYAPLDFPEAMAQQKAVWIASTGYGLGETDGLAGTELLLTIFSNQLTQGPITVGDALVASKHNYLSSLNPITVYDEKSSIQITLYGLPMYQLQYASKLQNVQPTTFNYTLSIQDGASTNTIPYDLVRVEGTTGFYYAASYGNTTNDTQSTAGRPVEPRIVYSLPTILNGGTPRSVHGVLLKQGTFTDYGTDQQPFDPVISRPTNEWEQRGSAASVEPRKLPLSFWPSLLGMVNNAGSLSDQRLVVIPGQFRPNKPTSTTAGSQKGIQRLYNNLIFEVLRSENSTDWKPPVIQGIDLRSVSATTVELTVDAADSGSGVTRLVVLTIHNGAFTATEQPVSGAGPFKLNAPYQDGDSLLVQVADAAGNVASFTGKGANISVIQVDAGPDLGYIPGTKLTLTGSVPEFGTLKITAPVFYSWDFGDGTYDSGLVTKSTFTVEHTYTATVTSTVPQYNTTLKVTDSGGAIGVDTSRVTAKTTPVVSVVSSSINNTSTIAQPVTFTATVSANTGLEWTLWKPVPTGGTVTFFDSGTPLPTSPVVSGANYATATTTTTALAKGSHTITATYSGDTFFYSGGTGSMAQPQLVHYKFIGLTSPIAGSQYNIGRTIPVKFQLTDYYGNSVAGAVATVYGSLNGDTSKPYGKATYSSGQYQLNLDSGAIANAKPGDTFTITIQLDDDTTQPVPPVSIMLK